MIQGLRSVLLALLASLFCPAQGLSQSQPEDPVRQAVQKYQTKVDQLEKMTKRILADHKERLQKAEAAKRKLEQRNARLEDQLARLKSQLADANAERNRLQRSVKEREAENRVRKQPSQRLQDLEDQATRMERWILQLRQDVQELLRRPTVKRKQEKPQEIHIHIHGGPLILHIHGDNDHDDNDNDHDMVGSLHQKRPTPRKGR